VAFHVRRLSEDGTPLPKHGGVGKLYIF